MNFTELIKLIEGTAKAPEEMEEYGFPWDVTNAFLLTADEVHSVVMSRVPGKAATGLIDEGYDLKGMYIKAKSCDWGPMAGFVCELPPFNKKGVDGIDFNVKKINDYKNNFTNGTITGSTLDDSQNPYTHLKISDKRKEEIFGNNGIAEELNIQDKKGNEQDVITGYAYDKADKPTVAMQFLMKKEQVDENKVLWALYHGQIFTLKDNKYEEFDLSNLKNSTNIKATWVDDKIVNKFKKDNNNIYPIRGLINPYPPYKDKESYKNAVAGDYDLFAVWPYKKEGFVISDSLVRATEELVKSFDLESVNADFGYFRNKKLSVFAANNANIYIEFVTEEEEENGLKEKELEQNKLENLTPKEKEIKEKEFLTQKDILKESGNINNIIYTTAQMLNSFVKNFYMKKSSGDYPNRAFHSDEGGRPGVSEIDCPFAVFLPLEFINIGQKISEKFTSIMLIETPEQFVTLINMLKESCYVLLNYGWLIELFKPQYDSIKDDLKKMLLGDTYVDNNNTLYFIKKRLEEIAEDQDPVKRTGNREYEKSENKIKHFMKPYTE